MKSLGRQLFAAAAAAALALGGGAAMADVKAGVDAWMGGKYDVAIREWRPLAEAGDPDAQFNLGQAYRLGRGVTADPRAAETWFEKAAKQGHEQAQANLGLSLFQNGDRARAMPWIVKAAEAGDPRAQYVLGTALFNGDLVGKNWPRAYALMTLAAGQGLPPAASSLQQMDKMIPIDQRRQGIALAQQIEKTPPAVQQPVRPAQPRPSAIVARTPVPASTPARPAPAAAGGGWKVQLGAFSSAANAQRAWATLRSKVGPLASLQPRYVPAGAVTRLQAGGVGSRAAADQVCAAAKAAGSACFPVAP
jgi:tetratricopeptide (TPR) repeat protein